LAFSGGGKRSAAFAHGALRGLRQIQVAPAGGRTRDLLAEVNYISSVSGGSFPAMHYGLYRAESFERFPREFLKVDVESYIYGMFLLPWNWEWMLNPYFGTNDYMASVYDRLMFEGKTYADLAERGPPLVSINATDIANGASFQFLGDTFGTMCSDLNTFPVARAVAASNGFPVLFTPITIENHAAACAGERPSTAAQARWAEDDRGAARRRAQLARQFNRYADADRTKWVHLMDGGIVDNLALRGLMSAMIGFASEDSPLVRYAAQRVRRILVLSVDGQGVVDPKLSQQRIVTGLGQILSAASSSQIDSYNFETQLLAEEQVRNMARRFAELRCRMAATIDGFPCDDVEGSFVHIALSGIEDPAMRARLEAIPTGLTIPASDVDALVAFGEQLVRGHPALRAVAAAAGPGKGRIDAPPTAATRKQ
ncbi:MAG: patatin-like phospholipase family protein, partial [Alphaproteobacteria bacterium]